MSSILNPDGNVSVNAGRPETITDADDETKDFVVAVAGFTEDTWTDIFAQSGESYRPPKIVLFTGAVDSACGFAQAAAGPFYCRTDERVYLDLSFFQELHNRFQAPGDFAQAYVIAHEIGHHIQNLLQVFDRVESLQKFAGPAERNEISVRLELQADCFSGVWANRTEQTQRSRLQGFLESGDVDEALRAASMIGDDRLQMQAQGYVIPETFTHGTAEQRSRWFRRGLEMGSTASCNTFAVSNP
jgi:predicted metalloprotease